jgi:hypothetical protein
VKLHQLLVLAASCRSIFWLVVPVHGPKLPSGNLVMNQPRLGPQHIADLFEPGA